MKGILLAGGSGTRLYPITQAVSKQLLPVFDKPMVYYPLTTLMLAGIRDVLLITTPIDQSSFQRLLGDGAQFGIRITYAVQDAPRGIPEAFLIGRDFIGDDPVALILGDNLFFGQGLSSTLQAVARRPAGATVFCYWVEHSERYGVLEIDDAGRPAAIVEKPVQPRSHFAVTGLYFYDNSVVEIAANLQPSPRSELEITDINRIYLERDMLHAEFLGRGMAWLDTGTPEALLEAGQFVEVVEKRQGLKVACPEEVSWRMGFIDDAGLRKLAESIKAPGYQRYVLRLLEERPSSPGVGSSIARTLL